MAFKQAKPHAKALKQMVLEQSSKSVSLQSEKDDVVLSGPSLNIGP